MLYISPIYLESATAVYAEFFEDKLQRSRWGTMGHWLGRGVPILGLRNPAELKALEHLLNGLTPDGSRGLVSDARDPKRVAGWQMVLKAPARLNNEWGVATREAQIRIERGFAQGVNRTLRCWEDVVTGTGTLAPRPDSPKTVTAVFRTNAAWDQTPELQATAMLMNVGLQSTDKAMTFSPSQVMSMQSGLRDFFARALYVCLDEQVGRLKSFASRKLGIDQVVKETFDKAAKDAMRRSTWARRDDRGAREDKRSEMAGTWRLDADQLAFKSYWTRNMQVIDKPRQFLADLAKERRNGQQTNGNGAQHTSELQRQETREAERQQASSPVRKSKEHLYGHSH